MDLRQQSKISELLMAREEELVRIWDLEQEIHRILGKPHPLPPPPALPSRRMPAGKGTRKERDAGPRIRPLRLEESAYQVTYDAGDGDTATTLEAAADLVRDLLARETPSLRILRVEAVRIDGNTAVPTEQLFPPQQD